MASYLGLGARTLASGRSAALATAVAFASGCRSDRPTYYEDVRPILEANCVSCHQRGGVAPVPALDSFESAASQARNIRRVVQSREMPPWLGDNTGNCGTFRGAAWLDARDIATLSSWAEGGHAAGDPKPAAGRPREGARFGPATATLDTGVYTPGLGRDGYRCFVTDPGLDRDGLVTALRVISTEPRPVAQLTLFALDEEAAESEAGRLDEAEPGGGYTCYGTPRTSSFRFIASWTWGAPVLRLPAAVRLHARRKVVVQVHYDIISTGLDVETRTRVELESDSAAREAQVLRVAAPSFSLPPRRSHAEVRAFLPVTEPLQVAGAAPRMHTLGRVLQLRRHRASEDRCLASFDHWSFYRQQSVTFDEPIELAVGDELALTCVYTTLNRRTPVGQGESIEEEECASYLYVTRP